MTNTITKEERELAEANLGYLFRKYSLPAVMAMLLVGIISFIDGLFVGNFVGVDGLAGINIAMPLYSLILAIICVLGIGCMTVVSTALGARNYTKANSALRSAFIALFLSVTLISIIIYIYAEEILLLMGANAQLLPYSLAYIKALSPLFPLLAIFMLGDFTLKGSGRPVFASIIMLVVVLLNVLLDYIFIAHLDMGARGAGLATGLSFSFGAVIVTPFMFLRCSLVSIRKRGGFSLSILGRMLFNGSSEGITQLSVGIAMTLFNRAMIEYFGADGVAVLTAISYLQFIGIAIFLGISDGVVPIMAFNHGAGNSARVERIFAFALRANLIIGVMFGLVLFVFSKEVTSLFFDNDIVSDRLMQIADYGAKVWAFAFLFNGANILMSAYFTAMGDAIRSAIISLCRGLIFVVLGIVFYPKIFSPNAVWFSVPIAEFITVVISAAMLYVSARRRD